MIWKTFFASCSFSFQLPSKMLYLFLTAHAQFYFLSNSASLLFTEQFLEFVNFMSWASPLFKYKSLSPAHLYAPRSYHIPQNRREPAGTSISGYMPTEATEKMSNKKTAPF